MINRLEDLPLPAGMLNLVSLNDGLFSQNLHRVHLLVVSFFSYKHDLAEASSANNLEEIKIIGTNV